MLLLGDYEKPDSEREIAWRCADSLALRVFPGYRVHQGTPNHTLEADAAPLQMDVLLPRTRRLTRTIVVER